MVIQVSRINRDALEEEKKQQWVFELHVSRKTIISKIIKLLVLD
jgi:hypothetical protein